MVTKALSTAGKTQGGISRQIGCSQSAVSKCLQGKSSGHKKCGRKHVTTKRDDRKLAKLVRSNRFHNFGEIAQQWNVDGVLMVCLHHDQQPIAEQRKWAVPTAYHGAAVLNSSTVVSSYLLWWVEVLHFVQKPRTMSLEFVQPYEAEKPSCTKSSIKFPQSTMVWGGMSAAGVGPLFSANKCHCCCPSRSLGAFSASDDWATVWRWRVHIPTRLSYCP